MRAGCRLVLLIALLVVWPAPSAALEVRGPPRVVDGDTLVIREERIRLQGIDAPETRQICLATDGRLWACGLAAKRTLAARIARRKVTCRGRRRDRYRRLVAACFLSGRNLGAWMVARGWALADPRHGSAYLGPQRAARAARRGFWVGRLTAPWDWRRGIGSCIHENRL